MTQIIAPPSIMKNPKLSQNVFCSVDEISNRKSSNGITVTLSVLLLVNLYKDILIIN